MALSFGGCGWALGKGDLSAPGTEPESGGGIKLSGIMRRGGPGLLVGTGGQAQVAENLDDDRGIFNGRTM